MTGVLMTLAAFLSLLGASPIKGAEDAGVAFSSDGPEGIYAVACHRELFGDEPGNAQALCGDLPDKTVLLYVDEIPDRRTLLSVLRHELAHFELGVNQHGRTAWERFREGEAYAIGNGYAARACRTGGC